MEPRVITTDSDYEAALAELDRLVLCDPKKGTPDADRLELFSVLIESYEREQYTIDKPSPVEAIQFRMEEQGLTQRELTRFLGSKSKVSEVLAGKLPLSLRMIRRLSEGLGIPADVLIQEPASSSEEIESIEWASFPVREMAKAGWLEATAEQLRTDPARVASDFFSSLGPSLPAPVLCRRKIHSRAAEEPNRYRLLAWIAQLIRSSRSITGLAEYEPGTVNADFISDLVRLSAHSDGPVRAKDFLARSGIALVVLPQLPKTKLDGASTLSDDGRPIIGMTLRYDRIDNFWFTLLHELRHVANDLSESSPVFVDDLDIPNSDDPIERDADQFAREATVPAGILRRDDAYVRRNTESVVSLANRLGIHPAIVAGRVRWETKNYRILSPLVGHRQVRTLFSEYQ